MRRVVVISRTYVSPANRGKLRALAARGLDVTAGVPQRSLEAALDRVVEVSWERQHGVELFPVPMRRYRSPEAARFATRALVSLLRDKRPDLLQVEEEPDTRLAQQVVRVARKLRIPVVLFTHRNVELPLPFLVRWHRKRALRRLAGVMAGSEGARAVASTVAVGLPSAVVPQLGVQVPTEPQHALHEGLAVGCVGRLVPEKGVDTLLQALAENRAGRWQLTVVGDGPDRERLERIASQLRLAARVRWAGALPPEELPRIFPELDVLVLPSRALSTWAEPSAHVVAEAMAHEVAVLGTTGGATPEVIGDAGLIVPPDDPGALAGALRRLAKPDERRPLAQAGRARVMRLFSDDAVAERTVRFWREVLA